MDSPRFRVLVVDDSRLIRTMIAHDLSRDPGIGCVLTAEDGRQAIEILQADCPDIIITDWEMPNMDGLALCRWIRGATLPHYVYVLLLTAKTQSVEMVAGLEAGADDFVSKPLRPAILRARLRAAARLLAMERTLRDLSESDSLTGVLNRRTFRKRFAVEWERANRHELPLACVMVDLDYFKKINDTHGHAAGDQAIVNVARILRDQRRSSDLVCRYGGEEFCVLLPETKEEGAAAWAERCRTEIEQLVITAGNNSFRLSASLGVAQRQDDVPTPEALVDLADQSLAVAKQSGRNRVVRYSQLADPILSLEAVGGKGPLDHAVAKDVMTEAVICPRRTETVRWVTDVFLQLRLSSAPVVDDEDRLVGVISETDLMSATATGDNWQRPVEDFMRSQVVSFDENAPIKDIFRFFSRASVRRVVIVANGHPTGVISRANVLRWFRNWSAVCTTPGPNDKGAKLPVEREGHLANIGRLLESAEQRTAAVRRRLFDQTSDPLPGLVGEVTRLQELADDLLGHCRGVVHV